MSVALVTGGGRGIGRAICLALARDGHDIAIGYVQQQAAAEGVVGEVAGAGRRAVAVGGDVAEAQDMERVVTQVEDELGPVDVLIANAGIVSPPIGVLDIRLKDWQRMLAVNLTGAFLVAQRVFAGMCEREHGRIVFISSVAAYTGGIIGAHYAASKAGLHGLAHSLASQGAGHGVTVNVVAPALIETDMMPADPEIRRQLGATRAVGRLGTPEEVGDLVAAVVRNGYLSNQSILLDGGNVPR